MSSWANSFGAHDLKKYPNTEGRIFLTDRHTATTAAIYHYLSWWFRYIIHHLLTQVGHFLTRIASKLDTVTGEFINIADETDNLFYRVSLKI